jgi:outer membrane protein assembly factor BamB
MRRATFGLILLALVMAGCTGGGGSGSTSTASQPSGATPTTTASPTNVTVPPRPTGPLPGYLLIADRGNDRMLLVDGSKRILWRYPRPGVTPSIPFAFDDDTFFTPDHIGIISNQEDQETIQVISFPAGKIIWHYGHVNVASSADGYLHTPDDAYMLPDGTRTVADISNCRVLFIAPSGKILKQYGTTRVCRHDPPKYLALPNGDTPMPDGGTLVTEITGSWIDAISADGQLEWTVRAPVGYPSDAQWLGGGKILLADYSYTGHVLIMTKTGHVLWEYGPSSGPGRLSFPSLALMLPNGLVVVNDDFRNRVIVIDPKTNRIVWQYGQTDVAGSSPGLLDRPDGMDFVPYDVAVQTPVLRRYLVHILGKG